MARGLPTTGTITLNDVRKAFSYNSSNVISTSTYTSGSGTSATAPTGACWALIQIWGGGGGGCGYNLLYTEYGGGGGAYTTIKIPVVAGVTNFAYAVGAGGTGGSAANGINGGGSTVTLNNDVITADGGNAGKWGVAGSGGITDAVLNETLEGFSGAGAAGTTSSGGNDGSGAASGGVGSTGAAGSSPGGGGAPRNSSGAAGGNGGAGQITITWYGMLAAVTNIRSYLAGGTYVKAGAAGYNSRNIPASGTINLRDFLGAEEVGMYANTTQTFTGDNQGFGGTITSNCYLIIQTTGDQSASGGYTLQRWLRNILSDSDTNVTQHFDVLFNRTAAAGDDTVLYGDAANTWYQCSTARTWACKASRATVGTDTSTMSGYLAFRRRSDNVVVANVLCNFSSSATRQTTPDGK